uniref:Uncharacterized protein n=1 Tax=viral metagenome TaxID=1070528 RepID=A0A6M3KAV9_9ZZZZ
MNKRFSLIPDYSSWKRLVEEDLKEIENLDASDHVKKVFQNETLRRYKRKVVSMHNLRNKYFITLEK